MFDDDLFDKWLDNKSKDIFVKLGDNKTLSSEEMIILVLKAQTNHFAHLDRDLREEMLELRKDMDRRFEQVDRRFEQVDKRFEQVDKRFEQVDKRFEQVDRHFENMVKRMDLFIFWSLGITVSCALFVVTFLKH